MNKYLIVVDAQRDFVDGVLGTPEARAIMPRIKEKILEHRANGSKIIFTRDTRSAALPYVNGRLSLHCVIGTDGWKICDELMTAGAQIINKPTTGHLSWENYIEDAEGLEIEIVGPCTDKGVVSNAIILRNMFPGGAILVDPTACSGATPESHEAAIMTMRACRIDVRGS